MTKIEIQLPRRITNQLYHLAQLSPDREVCGLIGAVNGLAHSCYPIENTSEQPKIRYQMDAKQQISAIASMRDNNEDFFAIYHSHPTAPAIPSATDIELAAYPEAIYLIISLNTKGVLEMRGFKIIDKQTEEIILRLQED